MKLNYLKYLLNAKGRHGTHSPFVYSFVEKVLRPQKKNEFQTNNISKNQKRLLQLIGYLQVKTVLLLEKNTQALHHMIQDHYPKINCAELINFEANKDYGNTLLITDLEKIDEETLLFLKQLKHQDNCSLYFAHIHHNRETELTWDKISELENFPLSLDFWEAGLLIQDESFKVKQHFLLK